ncbi:Panacea domain-containing protein [Pectobacterium polaris]|uniref:DUF4065 domain-containing protein n=1 Tax=Pectobacterium polaris TaxID=2042057 RepID=A0AAW5GFR4_9GAMM|nr:Panacea domain-containing protein [Pectobacterium polaris]MCL6352652.1 DUF4065 domain-containing protein [Pectobacterium polaris]MCL6369865.1 DUF4065 domain-containing protein [Pectobacterium polaris]
MKSKLQEIVAYVCSKYPHKGELSKARLTKLVYLADWFSALADGKQISNIDWLFNHYGPYVDDVVSSVVFSSEFSIEHELNFYGSGKDVISYKGDDYFFNLNPREMHIIDFVINKTSSMYFNDFISYVYSTYPVQANERYAQLDLVRLAREYKLSN